MQHSEFHAPCPALCARVVLSLSPRSALRLLRPHGPDQQALPPGDSAFRRDLIAFAPGQRKEDVAAEYRARFPHEDGVLFIGKAQEKTLVFRTERRRNPRTGKTYPWIVRTTAMVNHYYFYCVDRDFGRFFLKFCSYFPYTAKLCVNRHEYVKRRLTRAGIAFEALDNGLISCAEPRAGNL